MHRILVLRGGALGDFIVTLPTLALLRERWPRARLELSGNVTAAQLAVARGLIDAAHSQHEARWSVLYGSAPLPPDFAAWLTQFDLVLSYWPDPDRDLQRRFPLRAGQQFLSAPALPARAPAAAHFGALLRELGMEPRKNFFSLSPLTPRPTTSAECIAIHPGSGSPRKNWPVENWRRLIDDLPGPVSLILGDAEIERPDGMRSLVPPRPDDPAPPPVGGRPLIPLINRPLEELVDHFARCRLFLGHDSGISHLAAACGARCVLLFGPTDPAVWAPPVPKVHVLRCDSNLASLPFADVRRAVMAALEDRT